MGPASKLLPCLLLLLLFSPHFQGYAAGAGCKVTDIQVMTKKTGRTFEQRPEYEVTIRNKCACPLSGVKIRCVGFTSYKPVDSKAFKQLGNGKCLINSGRPISPASLVKFQFAFLTPFDLIPVEARALC